MRGDGLLLLLQQPLANARGHCIAGAKKIATPYFSDINDAEAFWLID